ncbi:MAG: NADAR family protein [Alphaproteobacteria bacterium]|nr:NADAR family protein [Alphaproteobacteria bacterium]MCB9974219.1 NADAR family protein [Rhodospirillales bacterium]
MQKPLPISKSDLISALGEGQIFKFLCFWSHEQNATHVTKACLSQWYPSSFCIEGRTYLTAEHFMMAEKAKIFGDIEKMQEILSADNPGKAKALGREITGFSQEKWDKHKLGIVIRGNIEKFSQNISLGEFLLKTGDRILVESSPRDRIWGCGLAENDQHIENPEHWPGENLLGFALMEVRRKLRKQ